MQESNIIERREFTYQNRTHTLAPKPSITKFKFDQVHTRTTTETSKIYTPKKKKRRTQPKARKIVKNSTVLEISFAKNRTRTKVRRKIYFYCFFFSNGKLCIKISCRRIHDII